MNIERRAKCTVMMMRLVSCIVSHSRKRKDGGKAERPWRMQKEKHLNMQVGEKEQRCRLEKDGRRRGLGNRRKGAGD